MLNNREVYTPKQKILLSALKHRKLKRINILEGSVRSGKTWISLVLWAFWICTRPSEYLYMMCAKNLTTLKRNCLLPLQDLVGKDNFIFSLSTKEGVLFGHKILLEGANDARAEGKIRGLTLAGAYCDELTLFPEDFFTMLLSRLSVAGAKLIATTNPDHPRHWLKMNYIDRADELDVFVMKFLIDDNTFLPPDYIVSLKKEYVGVFNDRFIKGLWVVAEGAIYRIFAENKQKYYITPAKLPHFKFINIGVDFGGNGSAHTFVATGIDNKYRDVVVLRSERHEANGMSPEDLYNKYEDFCLLIKRKYGFITATYADSAEQTLINGMRQRVKKYRIPVYNSKKNKIIDRIRMTLSLMAAGRFFYIPEECQSLENAFEGAVYDESDSTADSRLDNGTSDIDTLDAFEYSFERFIYQLGGDKI